MADMSTASGYELVHNHVQRTQHRVSISKDFISCERCMFGLHRKTSGWDEFYTTDYDYAADR